MTHKKLDIKRLKEYSEDLDNLARSESTDTFPNKNHQHASIAISKILKYSKKSFVLFDDDLQGDVVNNEAVVSFRDSIIEFISRGGNVKIVISDKNDIDDVKLRVFLEVLVELFPEQVELKIATSKFKKSMKSIYGEKINFAIGDNNKYRLEMFGENPTDLKTRKAKGSFNDEKLVYELLNTFNDNYSKHCNNYIV